MKNIIINSLIIVFVFTSVIANAQCDRNKYCKKELYGDYNYKGQSNYAVLSPGDTSIISVILYSNQDYRIIVCSEPQVGVINYKVYETRKIKTRSINRVERSEYNGEGNEASYDTVYITNVEIKKELLFDNLKAVKSNYYDISVKGKARRVDVEVVVPKDNGGAKGCVSVLIGVKTTQSTQFKRQ